MTMTNSDGRTAGTTGVVCDDGSMWVIDENRAWFRLPDIPQDDD